MASAAALIATAQSKNENDSLKNRLFSQLSHKFSGSSLSECAGFNDKHLNGCLEKVEKGVAKL